MLPNVVSGLQHVSAVASFFVSQVCGSIVFEHDEARCACYTPRNVNCLFVMLVRVYVHIRRGRET